MSEQGPREFSHVTECGGSAIPLCGLLTADEVALDEAMSAMELHVERLCRNRPHDREMRRLGEEWRRLAVAVIEIATDARVYHQMFVHGDGLEDRAGRPN